jgi:hypothetical protein
MKSNVCAGGHAVTVTDQKDCSKQGIIALNNTPALPLNLGGGVTLCVGQTYVLDAGPDWSVTNWTSNTGFSSTAQKVTIKDPGQYKLKVVNDKGCMAEDNFLLQTSLDLLKANFYMASQAEVADTVVLIDVSWPIPEKTIWEFPKAMKVLVNQNEIVFGQFNEAGKYEVNLKTELGECRDHIAKTITIVEGTNEEQGGRLGYEEFVKDFTLYPNPTDGEFEVNIELAETSEVVLSIWNLTTGHLLNKVSGVEKDHYKLLFDLRPLNPGVYTIRLDHAKGKQYIRFIVK